MACTRPGPVMSADPHASPTLSLLLCTLGRTEPLVRSLAHLREQTCRSFEIVVVDQNAPGHLAPVLAAFADLPIRHVTTTPGLSRARNVGLAACRGTLIAFPDDDCWYPPTLVADVIARFAAAPEAAVLLGRTLDAHGRESLGRFLARDAAVDARNVWFAGNSNSLFVRGDAARAVGGFDETLGVGAATRFKSGEETDFVLRLLRRGYNAIYRHDLVVHHEQVGDGFGAAGLRRAAAYAPGFGRVLRLHRYGLLYLTARVLRTLASAALAAVRGRTGETRYKLIWARGTLDGYLAPNLSLWETKI